jgi:hypothetical protein
MTLISCVSDLKKGWVIETQEAEATQRAATVIVEAATATHEAATAIAGIATYEARATSEAAATGETQETISSGGCSTPGAWCVVEGRSDDWGRGFGSWVVDRNEVKIAFPVDGGPVSGNFHFAFLSEYRGDDGVCVYRYDYFATLSGQFDPESGRLEGPVDDYTRSIEKLEGCPNTTFDQPEDPGAISWWATYDLTAGLEGEFVHMDAEYDMRFRGHSVSEQPSNPLD